MIAELISKMCWTGRLHFPAFLAKLPLAQKVKISTNGPKGNGDRETTAALPLQANQEFALTTLGYLSA
jgi:hypothetical protein